MKKKANKSMCMVGLVGASISVISAVFVMLNDSVTNFSDFFMNAGARFALLTFAGFMVTFFLNISALTKRNDG